MATDQSFVRRICDGTPYPNAKPHFRIDDALDDPPLLRRLLLETAAMVPLPKPKAVKAPAPRGNR